MAGIIIKVTGLNEAISFFNIAAADISQTTQTVLNDAADLFVSEATKNVHVITGRLKGSISKSGASRNNITVGATAPYAVHENRRIGSKPGQGPHDFATKALDTTAKELPDMLQTAYDELFIP